MNLRLAAWLAWQSLRHHRAVALATVLGVALGMAVVGAILVVDFHSSQARVESELAAPPAFGGAAPGGGEGRLRILRVHFERQGRPAPPPSPSTIPTQEGQAKQGLSAAAPPTRRGEEDYQAMRLAVRLASLLAFAVGAVIVFYTMRFSVASRGREFCLLLCLGEKRGNAAASLLLETLALGLCGTLLGLALALPAAFWLIALGVSTTGRKPSADLSLPLGELAAMGGLSVAVALLAAAGPARAIFTMRIVEVLQPRFMSAEIDERSLHVRGFGLLLPPLLAAAYLALRPFLLSWLTVVQFFLLESAFALGLALAVLWWMDPLLRALVRLFELGLKPWLPLETLLAGRRMRLTSHKLVFTLAGAALVFSLLTALHDITRALKDEIHRWSGEALSPYVFFQKSSAMPLNEALLQKVLDRHNLHLFRLSEKTRGEFPARLALAADINPLLAARGLPPLAPGAVIASRTLAARFGVAAGDVLVVETAARQDRFKVIGVTDAVGYFAENGQYVDLKSYLLFSEGNPLFQDNLERSLGLYAAVRARADGGYVGGAALAALRPFYSKVKEGSSLRAWQKAEIDRDFLIFDFILATTVLLAAVGVANTILIQVHARSREFSVLRTLGVSRAQTFRLLLVEGALIGLVAALLALLLGNVLGAISVSFLDRFTLFEYRFEFSPAASLAISLLAVAACSAAAVYPALVAGRISSAESLHYE